MKACVRFICSAANEQLLNKLFAIAASTRRKDKESEGSEGDSLSMIEYFVIELITHFTTMICNKFISENIK